MQTPASGTIKKTYGILSPEPRVLAARLYSFVIACLGDKNDAESFILKELGKTPLALSLPATVKKLLPGLLLARNKHGQEPAFQDLGFDARLIWTLQILAGLSPTDRVLILMRDLLEWSHNEIASCLDISVEDAAARVRLARHDFTRQKEVMLTRRQRRR